MVNSYSIMAVRHAILVAATFVLTISTLSSCNNKIASTNATNAQATATSNTYPFKEVNLQDSSKLMEVSLKTIQPDGDNVLLNASINEWICSFADNNYLGKQDDFKALFEYTVKALKDFYKDYDQEEYSGWPVCPYTYYVDITRDYENKNVITLSGTLETYGGGAHGIFIKQCQTFDKTTGKRIGKNIFKSPGDSNCDIEGMTKQGLIDYFNKECHVDGEPMVTEDNLYDNLMLDSAAYIPEPKSEPWFKNDSIFFIYQQYEITPYAAGLPSFGIPIDKIKDMITPQAYKLLKGK